MFWLQASKPFLMLIAHVIESLDPATGGPPAAVVRLAAAQAAAGHEVTILTGDEPARSADVARSIADVPGLSRVKIVRWPASSGWRRVLASDARGTLADFAAEQRPDWFHLHTVWGPPIRAAATIAHARHIKYCLTPHGMLDPWSLHQRRFKKRLALAAGYRAMLRHATFLHALSITEESHFRRLRLGNRTAVAPNGVFPEEFASLPGREAVMKRWRVIGDAPYVLFLGRLDAKKRPVFLAEAFALAALRVPECRLVFAGPDAGEESNVRRVAAKHRLSERTHVVGPVYGSERLALLAHAVCFVLPSVQEGMSVAMLEAMASGVPAAGPFEQPADVRDASPVIPVTTREALAADLVRLLRDAELRRRLGLAGKRLVESRYTWPAVAATIFEAMSLHA